MQRIQRLGRSLNGSLRREVVEISFTDTGPGMPKETLENIFIPFFTTKDKGTGLGLAICQRIVKSLGGTIEVRSTLGKGTTFSVILPIAGEEVISASMTRTTRSRSAG